MIYKLLCRLHCKSKTKILRFKINPITKMLLNFNTIQIDGYITLADLIAAIRNCGKNRIERGSLHFQEKRSKRGNKELRNYLLSVTFLIALKIEVVNITQR